MAKAESGDSVKIHYKGTLSDGTVFDSSAGREPLQFTLGSGQVIQGFDEAVIGMEVGESKTAEIPAVKAYGPWHEEMVISIGRDQFPADITPEVGQKLELQQHGGQLVIVEVTEVSGESVTLDANPPLAGKDLTFDIELVEIL